MAAARAVAVAATRRRGRPAWASGAARPTARCGGPPPPTPTSFQQVGTLNAGTNYFYCQANLGRRETYGKWTNVWWAKTDDDSGNSGVYVSVVYLTGGAERSAGPRAAHLLSAGRAVGPPGGSRSLSS